MQPAAASPNAAPEPFLTFSVSSLAYAAAWARVAPGGWQIDTLEDEPGERLDITPPLAELPAAFMEPLPGSDGGVVAVRIRPDEVGGGFVEIGRFRSIVDAFHAIMPLCAEHTAELGAILANPHAT